MGRTAGMMPLVCTVAVAAATHEQRPFNMKEVIVIQGRPPREILEMFLRQEGRGAVGSP